MNQHITATDAVRNFSELLNNIRYRGDKYTILKGGKPAATIGPVTGSAKEKRLSELKDIMHSLPQLNDDISDFAKAIKQIIAEQPLVEDGNSWA